MRRYRLPRFVIRPKIVRPSVLNCRGTSLLAQDHLTGPVEPNQVERVLPDVDADNRAVFKASFLLRTHGCFSFDADDPGSG
jgi:hypothetical protein